MTDAKTALNNRINNGDALLVLTGAGISQESGIPTFRGPEGYWTVGSDVYRPETMATNATFSAMPEESWNWYLHRRRLCRDAEPNAAHCALASAATRLGPQHRLITQNVDGLHIRAGSPAQHTYQIHGNIEYMRCADECSKTLHRIPDVLDEFVRSRLSCPACGALTRPHVLWFDECYDEELFHFDSSLEYAQNTGVLLVVGTSGATNLPNLVAQTAAQAGALVIDINPEENPFSALAQQSGGFSVRATACGALPPLLDGNA